MTDLDDHIQKLIGCSWGRTISLPDDRVPCPERAVQIVVLHEGPKEYEVRLCPRHLVVVNQRTDPRG